MNEYPSLKAFLADSENRGPVNSPEWRARHPEYDGPYRKAGQSIDVSDIYPTTRDNVPTHGFAWWMWPERYERVPEQELEEDNVMPLR